MIWNDDRTKLAVIFLLGAGIFLRFYFYFGHVYSDDSYLTYLGYTLYKGDFGVDYPGSRIFLLNAGQAWINAFSFSLFGTNEAATTVFPMIFSILNMVLCYRLTKIITKSEISAILVLFFTAFYPTEILFASVVFPDLFPTVFINAGIMALFLANRDKKILYSVLAGFLFFISLLFKIDVFYTSILIFGLLVYQLTAKRSFNIYIFTTMTVLCAGIIAEGGFYFMINGDFFYRLSVICSMNAIFELNLSSSSVFYDIADNIKAVFFERAMLFVPALALIQPVVFWKERKNRLVVYWFTGLLLLYLFSIQISNPWRIFPLFLPAMILASKIFSGLKKGWMIVLLALYISASLYMTEQFRGYFDTDNIAEFEKFIKADPGRAIYAEPLTKYSIDLTEGFSETRRTFSLSGKENETVPDGAYVVLREGQDEEIFMNNGFSELKKFGSFTIYEKKH
jgi:hypothetical protein